MREWKYFVVTLVSVIVFLGCAEKVSAAGNKGRYVAKAGNFSISIPEKWEAVEVKGIKYKILRGIYENDFAPSISFVDEDFTGQVDDYILNFKDALNEAYGENIEYILQGEFVTSKGVRGRTLVFTTYQKEMLIQQSFFYFQSNKGKIITVTCTNLADDYSKYIKLFDQTVKTFEWIK